MIKRLLMHIVEAIRDPERKFSDRVFLLFTIISDIAVTIALISDILTGENINEIILLSFTIVLVPTITFSCLFKERVDIAIRLIIVGLVLVILPVIILYALLQKQFVEGVERSGIVG